MLKTFYIYLEFFTISDLYIIPHKNGKAGVNQLWPNAFLI